MTEGLFETRPLSLCVPIFCGVTHRRFVAFLPSAEIKDASVAVPVKPLVCSYFVSVTHRRFAAFLPAAEIIVASVAVPEKIIGLTLFLDFFDRYLSFASLHLPPAALGSLPVFELVAPSLHRRLGF